MTKPESLVTVRTSPQLRHAIEEYISKGEEYIYPSSKLFELLDAEGFVSKDSEFVEGCISDCIDDSYVVDIVYDRGPNPNCEECKGECSSNECEDDDRLIKKIVFYIHQDGKTFLPTTIEQDNLRNNITYNHRIFDPNTPGFGYFKFIELLNSLTAEELINLPIDFDTWSWNISEGIRNYKTPNIP